MINYQTELNPAQYEAATTLEGPVLVIAGAGSGKTRTIVYRLARLVESGVPASSILLLTFTRKAAQEMLDRAKKLLGQRGHGDLAAHGLAAVQGGTFHAYAYSVLRMFKPEGYAKDVSVMDSSDSLSALQHCREALGVGKGDRSFPKNQTVHALLSKSRNREQGLEEILRRESPHLLPHGDDIARIGEEYRKFKRDKSLMDYDDLLFELEGVLRERTDVLRYCRSRHSHIMVDEYQDTNLVQARIVHLLAGGTGKEADSRCNILAVGDDAQSIYAFRGANVQNILNFPESFPKAKLVRLEENYRSTQPILDLCNAILEKAPEGYKKHLFTRQPGELRPRAVRPMSDLSQAGLVAARIVELLRVLPPREIAVLFRAGYQSYHVEVQLNKMGVRFRKYGGLRYTDAAHVKDAMSFARLVLNPLDYPAFQRMAEQARGIGGRTCLKIYQCLQSGDAKGLEKACNKYPALKANLTFVDAMRKLNPQPVQLLGEVIAHYKPTLEMLYPDDYPRRLQGLEQLAQIAGAYRDLDLLVADLSLDDPLEEQEARDCVTLSTIHSAKGLEWKAVLLLDLVEDRFPSRHALARPEDYEEERRLMYVACTRAGEYLDLFIPATLYDRGGGGNVPALPSPFVRELDPDLYEEWQESYSAGLTRKSAASPQAPSYARPEPRFAPPRPAYARPAPEMDDEKTGPKAESPGAKPALPPEKCGFCTHRIFGRGKIVKFIPPDKYQVNFPGLGLKVIIADYLVLE